MSYEERLRLVNLVDATFLVVSRELALPDATIPTSAARLTVDPGPRMLLLLAPPDLDLAAIELERPLLAETPQQSLFEEAWLSLLPAHREFHYVMLEEPAPALDGQLAAAHLSGPGLALKEAGFRQALRRWRETVGEQFSRRRWFRSALKWADIPIGSLVSAVPVLGRVVDPLKQYKEAVEAQLDAAD